MFCRTCRNVLRSAKSKLYGKCVLCRDGTKFELNRLKKWDKFFGLAHDMPEENKKEFKIKRKVIIGLMKARRNYLKHGSYMELKRTINREFNEDSNEYDELIKWYARI